MILQFGTLFTGLTEGISRGLTGLFKDVGPELITAGRDFATDLLRREITRKTRRDTRDLQKAQAREASNNVGGSVAVAGQTAVATGGRVFAAPLLNPAVAPPATAAPAIRPLGLAAAQAQVTPAFLGPLAGRAGAAILRGTRRLRPFEPAIPGILGGIAGAVGAEALRGTTKRLGIDPASGDLFFRGATGTGRRVGRQIPGPGAPFTAAGRAAATFIGPTLNGGMRMAARSIFQRRPDGCGSQFYVFDGQNFIPTDSNGKMPTVNGVMVKGPRFRLDLSDNKFKQLKVRRMNPLNFRALSRSRNRVQSALRVCRTMFTEARREKTARVRPKTRRRKK